MYVKLFLLKLRDFFIRNYCAKIIAFKKDNMVYYPKLVLNLLILFLRLVPFSVLIYFANFLKFQLIYSQDGTYQLSGLTQNHILPVIFKFNVGSSFNPNNDNQIDLKPIIKYYNSSLPLDFILNNNKLNNYSYIDITYLHLGSLQNKRIIIKSNKLTPLYLLFK